MIPSRRARRATREMPAYLLVATAREFAELDLLLSTLPMCAHGRVFIVHDGISEITLPKVPVRMSVSVFESGESCSRAIGAWASEMLCDDTTKFHGWFSSGAAHFASELTRVYEHTVDSISCGDVFNTCEDFNAETQSEESREQ